MKCKLCNLDKKLCKSHIIPESFWKLINDEKSRSIPISTKRQKLKFVQNGISEELLCSDCERKLSVFESSLISDLKDIGNKKSNFLKITEQKNGALLVENIRYQRFKLAALSILWRCSVSKHEFFSSYELGPYEEKIRKIIHDEICPPEKVYPIALYQYRLDNKFQPDIIMGFPKGKLDGTFSVQKFIIYGHMFLFVINEKYPNYPIDCFLREIGRCYVTIADSVELASRESAIARIFDEDVMKAMKKLSHNNQFKAD